jgi:hypothetical protein
MGMARMAGVYAPDPEVSAPPPPTGFTALDPMKTSLSLRLSNRGLTVLGSDHYGNAASIVRAIGQKWFEARVDASLKPVGGLWVGFVNKAHSFAIDGAAWGGQSPTVTSLYINGGGIWVAGTGYAFHQEDAKTLAAPGDAIMAEYDMTRTGLDDFGNPCPNGVIRWKIGGAVTKDYAAPLGDLYAAVGFDAVPNQATLNFGETPPVNPVSVGYGPL